MGIKYDNEGNLICFMCSVLLDDSQFDPLDYDDSDVIVCGNCRRKVTEDKNANVH